MTTRHTQGTMRSRNTVALIFAILLAAVAIRAHAQNLPPIADAGPDRTTYTNVAIELNGSGTDPDGDPIVEWIWLVESSPCSSSPCWTLYGANTPNVAFAGHQPGDYVLSLTVTDGVFFGTDYVTVHVRDNLPPVAIATADKTTTTRGGHVCFDGSQSYDPEGGPLTYTWDFADGLPQSHAVSVCHTFDSLGTFNVTLRVTDELGASDSDVIGITVNPPTNHPPTASPSATPNSGRAPLAVQFAANASDADGDALSYSWDFGDGSGSHLTAPSHTYTSAGTFTAQLTVSDGKDSISKSLTITVSPAIEFNVTLANIDFKGRQSELATVKIQAGLFAAVPGSDDLVALSLDGDPVFSATFSQFATVRNQEGTYRLKTRDLLVVIDFVKGALVVNANKVLLPNYDPTNGVDVEVRLGSATAVDNIQPRPEGRARHYRFELTHRGSR